MINHGGKFLLTNNLAGGDVLDGAGKTRGLSIYGEAGMADWIDRSLAWKCQGIRVFPVRHLFFLKRFREGPILDVLSKTDIRYFCLVLIISMERKLLFISINFSFETSCKIAFQVLYPKKRVFFWSLFPIQHGDIPASYVSLPEGTPNKISMDYSGFW